VRALAALLAMVALFCAGAALARLPAAGVDYELLKNAQSVEASGRIEVIEFFWFRCPHCYAFEPVLEPWVAKLPAEVRFRLVPGMLKADWATDAQIFYALESIGAEGRLHRALFDAIHAKGSGATDLKGGAFAKWVEDWLVRQGVDMRTYRSAFESPAVKDKVAQARQINQAYRIEGVPTLAVQGRYVVTPFDKDRRSMLAIADYLIGEAMKQRAASARNRLSDPLFQTTAFQ
jgi:protein dithiol oxidoreductase (disulfide-forming)